MTAVAASSGQCVSVGGAVDVAVAVEAAANTYAQREKETTQVSNGASCGI